MPAAERAQRRWRAARRVTVGLLAIWFVVTFGGTYFAHELNGRVFGWPFSFWVATQGALLVYLALVCVYAWLMHRLDLEHDVAADD